MDVSTMQKFPFNASSADLFLGSDVVIRRPSSHPPSIRSLDHLSQTLLLCVRDPKEGQPEGLAAHPLSKKLSERWRGFVYGGYTFIGDPEGVNFRNRWWYDIGAGYDVNQKWNLSLYYEEYRAVVTTVNNARDLFFTALFKPTSDIRCSGSLLVGLSNGAPNYATTFPLTIFSFSPDRSPTQVRGTQTTANSFTWRRCAAWPQQVDQQAFDGKHGTVLVVQSAYT